MAATMQIPLYTDTHFYKEHKNVELQIYLKI